MKRIISVCLAVLLFAAVIWPFALPANSVSEKTKSTVLDIFKKENFIYSEGISEITEKNTSEASAITARAKAAATFAYLSAEFAPYDISEYTEAVFRIAIRGLSDKYSLEITLLSEDSSYVFSADVTTEETELHIPLEGEFKSSFSGMTISVSSEAIPMSHINLISFTVDNTYTYSYKNLFQSLDVYGEGSFSRTSTEVSVMPENGEIVAGFDFCETYTDEENVLIWFDISPSSTGSICAETTDEEGNVTAYSQQNISYDGTYAFVVRGGFESFALRLNLADKAAGATFTGAGSYVVGDYEKNYGSITSCRYDGKRISVSGSLSKEATTEYNGSKILLYAIPATKVSSFNITEYTPVASSGFSTKFKINYVIDKTYIEYFYAVFLEAKDVLLPVGNISAPYGGAYTQSADENISALYGADAADAFETNISSVIMNVCAGKLLAAEGVHSAQIYNYKKTYYFSNEYLKELDGQMRFYNAAGVKVYLRFYSDRDGYSFDYFANSEESVSLMCAVSSFISERYPQVAGYIIGIGANEHMTSLAAENAETKARIISVFAESIRSKNPSAQIVVPYSGTSGMDTYITCALVNHYFSKYNSGPVISMYEVGKDADGAYNSASQLSSIASQLGASSSGAAVLWNVPSDYSVEKTIKSYRDLCVYSQAQGLKLSALSVTRAEKSSELYDSLKAMLDTENLINASLSQYSAITEERNFKGSYAYWDFTSTYDTANWVSGGSFSAPVTAKGTGGRVMMAQSDDLSEGAGVLICRTESPINISDMCARISFLVKSDDLKSTDVTVIFGSGDARAEYIATVDCNKEATVLCDMAGFSGASSIDHAAIIVSAGQNSEAQISKIEFCSDEKSTDELKERFSPTTEKEEHPILYVITIFLIAGTVTVFSVLWKKQSGKKGAGHK